MQITVKNTAMQMRSKSISWISLFIDHMMGWFLAERADVEVRLFIQMVANNVIHHSNGYQ